MKTISYIISSILLISCQSPSINNTTTIIEDIPVKILAVDMPHYNVDDLPIESPNVCPNNMVHVVGNYCTDLRHTCTEKLDRKRCKRFDKNGTVCKGKEKPLSFCIDIEEYTKPGSKIPVHDVMWVTADKLCKNEGKRLCNNQEFVLACEGPERLPYSYGYERDSSICNIDITKNLGRVGHLVDHTQPIDMFPNCVSPYGVHNINGNVTEWTKRVGSHSPWRSGLMGGWWSGVRSECRPLVTSHFEYYNDKQVGLRCCKNNN